MSRYLEIAIGAEHYLLDAAGVLEICEGRPIGDDVGGDVVRWHGRALPLIDLRRLFATADHAEGPCIIAVQSGGQPAALLVDRVAGLIDLGDGEWCPLPPIGPFGMMIDAIATRLADDRPMLRLRGERTLATAAACRTDREPAISPALG